MHKVV